MKKKTMDGANPVNGLEHGGNVYTTLVRYIYHRVAMHLCTSSRIMMLCIVATVGNPVKRLDISIKS
jgi:hypothetical protein